MRRTGARDWRIERMAVTDNEMHACAARRRDHAATIVERERHRLLDQHVLAVARRKDRMTRVKLMGRRDVDDLDIGIGAELLDRTVSLPAKILREPMPCLDPRIRRRGQLNPRIAKGRQHDRERAAETRNADA